MLAATAHAVGGVRSTVGNGVDLDLLGGFEGVVAKGQLVLVPGTVVEQPVSNVNFNAVGLSRIGNISSSVELDVVNETVGSQSLTRSTLDGVVAVQARRVEHGLKRSAELVGGGVIANAGSVLSVELDHVRLSLEIPGEGVSNSSGGAEGAQNDCSRDRS